MQFSNKCYADAWSVPSSLITSDARAGKAFNMHIIRLKPYPHLTP